MQVDEYQALLAGRMTEKTLQAQVEQLARTLGWLVYHTHDSRRSAAGFPDLVLARGPRLVFAELKTTRGRVTPAQQQWLDALRLVADGETPLVEVYLWRPGDVVAGAVLEVLH